MLKAIEVASSFLNDEDNKSDPDNEQSSQKINNNDEN
jgi:hypothetical protein